METTIGNLKLNVMGVNGEMETWKNKITRLEQQMHKSRSIKRKRRAEREGGGGEREAHTKKVVA